jgi:hypothetical protein
MSAGLLASLCQTLKLPSVAREAVREGPRRPELPAGRDIWSICCNACRQKSSEAGAAAHRALPAGGWLPTAEDPGEL